MATVTQTVSSREVYIQQGKFKNHRGQDLHYRKFTPDAPPRAFLIYHHGYGGHCALYQPALQQLAVDACTAIFAYDAHGFGRSAPHDAAHRSYLARRDYLVDDVFAFVTEVVEKHQRSGKERLPLFMAGFSMGGMVATLAGIRDQNLFKGIVLLAPAIDAAWTPTLRFLAFFQSLAVKVVPHWRIVPSPALEWVSPDPAVVAAMRADPLMDAGLMPARSAHTFLEGFKAIAAGAASLRLPIFCAISPTDKAVDFGAVERLLSKVPSTDVTLVTVAGENRHDLLQSPERDAVLRDISAWLREHS